MMSLGSTSDTLQPMHGIPSIQTSLFSDTLTADPGVAQQKMWITWNTAIVKDLEIVSFEGIDTKCT